MLPLATFQRLLPFSKLYVHIIDFSAKNVWAFIVLMNILYSMYAFCVIVHSSSILGTDCSLTSKWQYSSAKRQNT